MVLFKSSFRSQFCQSENIFVCGKAYKVCMLKVIEEDFPRQFCTIIIICIVYSKREENSSPSTNLSFTIKFHIMHNLLFLGKFRCRPTSIQSLWLPEQQMSTYVSVQMSKTFLSYSILCTNRNVTKVQL